MCAREREREIEREREKERKRKRQVFHSALVQIKRKFIYACGVYFRFLKSYEFNLSSLLILISLVYFPREEEGFFYINIISRKEEATFIDFSLSLQLMIPSIIFLVLFVLFFGYFCYLLRLDNIHTGIRTMCP